MTDTLKALINTLTLLGMDSNIIQQHMLNIKDSHSHHDDCPFFRTTEKLLYSFENTVFSFDFGQDVNSNIVHSTINIVFNSREELEYTYVSFNDANNKPVIHLFYDEYLEIINFNTHVKPIKTYRPLAIAAKYCNRNIADQLIKVKEMFDCNEYIFNDVIKHLIDDTYIFNIENKYDFKIVRNAKQQNQVITNIFAIKNSFFNAMLSKFEINFDEFNVMEDIKINFRPKLFSPAGAVIQKICMFSINASYDLTSATLIYYKNGKRVQDDIKDVGLPFYDFLFLLQLQDNETDMLHELLPEIRIPSAYDFSSEDYRDRLNLASMILI